MRLLLLALTLLLAPALLLAGLIPAADPAGTTDLLDTDASVGVADSDPVTFYLHGEAANARSTADFVGAPDVVPWMDEAAPTGDGSAALIVTGSGVQNAAGVIWTGVANGFVSGASASLHLSAPVETQVTATLFGEDGDAFAQGAVIVGPATTNPVILEFEGAGNVDGELVLALGVGFQQAPVTLHYDSPSAPSSLTFVPSGDVEPPVESPAPGPGWNAPVLINATAAHRETSIAIDPTNPDLMIVCAPSGVGNTEVGQSYFHVSRDGGATWRWLDVETSPTDTRTLAYEGGDCDVAFDDAGTMYSADTWLGSLSVGHSTDGGATWTGTALATSVPIVDRPWLVGGSEGTVHVTWQDVQSVMPSAIWYARSTDFGLTFTPAAPVATATAEGGFTWTGNFVMTEDEEQLFSVYTRRQGVLGDVKGDHGETVWVARSMDGGATWTQHLVASMPGPASFLYPSIGIDAAGGLHVVFASPTDVDHPIWYAYSADAAQTWTGAVPVLSGVAGYSPWVVGGAGPGEAAIAWYGTLDPLGDTNADYDWYFFTARVANGVFTDAGPTTTTPIFDGRQRELPEFNQLRLDDDGTIHLGASAFRENQVGAYWALWYQREE